jgi:chitin-binding protein
MRIDSLRAVALCFLAFFAANVSAHGLVQDPPARNWFCGAITKPDHVSNALRNIRSAAAHFPRPASVSRTATAS